MDDPPEGRTGFFVRVVEDGVGFLIHPYSCATCLIESYGIAPGQLTPLAWCYMGGFLMLWGDLFNRAPSVAIWHHIYKLEGVRKKPGSY